ncbi:trypsin-like peptidase domain-containing protein [Bacillus sp. CECT 9360]|uniref:S1C family serine protease n=1 Tax=Bacillus sp. CECT 9360 TaxID=2845821 RepID=UPI001E3C1857|nr:trypsin-like peptidase domain-containing protein [Bacillus sp. CECT 9360]CAH0345136.1 hypothetical protein BCI9360_01415 [Bacillus sp. CECT 9360]
MKSVFKSKFFAVFATAAVLVAGWLVWEYKMEKPAPQTVVKEVETVKTVQVVEKEVAAPVQVKKQRSLKDIIQFSEDKVFQVLTDSSLGSAFLYDNKGHIVTNAHVVSGYKDVHVQTVDDEVLSGTVIGIGDEMDVAVIHVPALEGKKPLPTAENQAVKGDEVITFGSPNGLKDSVSTGIISGLKRDFDISPFVYDDVYQTTAPIYPGSSGGPLIDKETGEVIAINSASYINQTALSFSIPMQQVVSLIDSWIKNPMEWEDVQVYEDFYDTYELWDIPEDAYSEYEDSYTDESYSEDELTEDTYEEYAPEEDSETYTEEEYYEEEQEGSYEEEDPMLEEENSDSSEGTEDIYNESEIPSEDGMEAESTELIQ